MSRIAIPSRDQSPAASQPLLDAVNAQLGTIPNLFRLLGLSPAALEGFLGLSAALGKSLDLKTRNRLALTVAEANGCDYCLSAHSYLGTNLAKLDDAEMRQNRQGHSADQKADAALTFARKVTLARGRIDPADLDAVRQAGYSDGQVVEIIAHVALNSLTNFLNNAIDTDIDFPVVRAAA